MTKVAQFQIAGPKQELWVLDLNGQVWHQVGKTWVPVSISLPTQPLLEPTKAPEESFR